MTTINYHPEYLSGCKYGLVELLEKTPLRLYSRGNEYKIEQYDFFADFEFTWWVNHNPIFDYQTVWPIQMLSINTEIDYNSFISLN